MVYICHYALPLISFILLISDIQRYAPPRIIAKAERCLVINPGRWSLARASANSKVEKVRILGTAPAASHISENVTIFEIPAYRENMNDLTSGLAVFPSRLSMTHIIMPLAISIAVAMSWQ